MKIGFGLIVLLVLGAFMPVQAQDTFEVGAGYAYRSFDQNLAPPSFRINMNGFNVNAAYNLNSWLGVAGEITGTYNSSNEATNGDNSLYTFLAGPRVYPLGHHRIAPYVDAEFGGSHYSLNFPGVAGFAQRGFAWEAGGGADIFVTRHLGVKGQAEFEQTRFYQGPNFYTPGVGNPPYQKDFVFTVGPVFRF